MRLSAETSHLVKKSLHKALQPIEIIGCGVAATFVFSVCYLCVSFRLRYDSPAIAVLLGPLLFLCLTVAATVTAVLFFRSRRPSRTMIGLSLGLWIGLIAGTILGDKNWYATAVNYYTYQDMGTYVNVDPAVDKGQSFMDAGVVYFKESSYVLTQKALAFHNGKHYCVAPIVREPVEYQGGSANLESQTGFVLQRSGTVDFWAVGTDCCPGTDVLTFNCGETRSQLARSGMRALNDNERAMYLLAVQEWAASTGLPVRHPVFFTWVKDPMQQQEAFMDNAWNNFWLAFVVFLLSSVIGSLMVHIFLTNVCRLH